MSSRRARRPSLMQRMRRALLQPLARSSTLRDDTLNAAPMHAQAEDSSAKFWSVYLSEADRYDSALVESWRADMEGILIFSGLFSASLTAFLIESYKKLVPDAGDMTVILLSQISQQLSASSKLPDASVAPFTVLTSSLVCNAFWFVSLGLSLTCALLATLVEQWAREFIHKTKIRPSPVHRARVCSFLYYGISRFGIHAIVDAIPLLLHLGLVLFFAGLVAFLLPINSLMAGIVAGVLAVFLTFYSVITVLPVVSLECPYRTPLSNIVWRLVQNLFILVNIPVTNKSLTEAVLVAAMQRREIRDERAVLWTLQSLTDNTELLPFVEATHDIITGPTGFRRVDDHLFQLVLQTADAHTSLPQRILSLLWSAETLPATDPLRSRRRTAGLRALWALGIVAARSIRAPVDTVYGVDKTNLRALAIPPEYSLALTTISDYMHLNSLRARFEDVAELFSRWDVTVPRDRRRLVRDLRTVLPRLVQDVQARGVARPEQKMLSTLGILVETMYANPEDPASEADLQNSKAVAEGFSSNQFIDWPMEYPRIVVELLNASFIAGVAPYKLISTCEEILPTVASLAGERLLALSSLAGGPDALPISLQGCLDTNTLTDLDVLVRCALRLFPLLEPASFLPTLYWYLSRRVFSADIFRETFVDCDFEDLAAAVRRDSRTGASISGTMLCAIATLCLWRREFAWQVDCASVLDALEASPQVHAHPAYVTVKVIFSTAMMAQTTEKGRPGRESEEKPARFQHTLNALASSATDRCCAEVVHFLSTCACTPPDEIPYKAQATVEYLCSSWTPGVHLEAHVQLALTRAVCGLVECTRLRDRENPHPHRRVIVAVVKTLLGTLGACITDKESLGVMKETMAVFREKLESDDRFGGLQSGSPSAGPQLAGDNIQPGFREAGDDFYSFGGPS